MRRVRKRLKRSNADCGVVQKAVKMAHRSASSCAGINPAFRLDPAYTEKSAETSPTTTIFSLPALGSSSTLLPPSLAHPGIVKPQQWMATSGMSLRAVQPAPMETGLRGSSTASNASTELGDAVEDGPAALKWLGASAPTGAFGASDDFIAHVRKSREHQRQVQPESAQMSSTASAALTLLDGTAARGGSRGAKALRRAKKEASKRRAVEAAMAVAVRASTAEAAFRTLSPIPQEVLTATAVGVVATALAASDDGRDQTAALIVNRRGPSGPRFEHATVVAEREREAVRARIVAARAAAKIAAREKAAKRAIELSKRPPVDTISTQVDTSPPRNTAGETPPEGFSSANTAGRGVVLRQMFAEPSNLPARRNARAVNDDNEDDGSTAPARRHRSPDRTPVSVRAVRRTCTPATVSSEASSSALVSKSAEQAEAAKEAAKEAAARLRKGEAPVLSIEVHTERHIHDHPYQSLHSLRSAGGLPGSPTKNDSGTVEAIGEPPLSMTIERGQLHGPALPSSLKGIGAATTLTNTNGGPVLGQLSVGSAKLLFALYDGRERPAGVVETSQSGHAPTNPKMLEAIKGLSLTQATGGRGGSVPPGAGCFIAHPLDAVPVQRLTVIDPALSLAVEAHVERGRLKVFCRKATVAEGRRAEAADQLRAAEAGTDYALLHGKIVAARARGVDARRLDAAQARLKTLQPDVATKEELVESLKWDLVTAKQQTALTTGEEVCSMPGCTVGEPLAGEVLSFVPTAAEQALKNIKTDGVSPDRWLFERIAEAAAAASAEGGVWRAGGKFILSAITRNQSPTALNRYLTSLGHRRCAEGIDALVKWTETQYNHHVSAIQINVHIDSTCFHAQHRDIYGLEQRDMAGRDCTCSFKPNIATACLSIGSTRKCLVEAETDDFSELCKCCDGCKGYTCHHWLRSGSLMYFNDVWNKSHNHGIPANGGDADETGAGGPRISIALLCAAADNDPLSLACPMPKAKNIYSTLIDKTKLSVGGYA